MKKKTIFLFAILLFISAAAQGCINSVKPPEQEQSSLDSPSVLSVPAISDNLVQTEEPEITQKPEDTRKPDKTERPNKTEQPAKTQRPVPTEEPVSTLTPTSSPIPSPTPAPTPKPTVTPEPVQTKDPTPVSNPYRLEVDVTNQVVSVYEKDNNGDYTKLIRQMICSTGKPSTPTPKGSFTLPGGPYDRGEWGYFSKFKVWARYFTRIKGGILFHSVIYAKNDVNTLKQSTVDALGTPVSAGCIRLQVEDAKWIYENAKPGTIVDVVEKDRNPELTASLKPSKEPSETSKPQ